MNLIYFTKVCNWWNLNIYLVNPYFIMSILNLAYKLFSVSIFFVAKYYDARLYLVPSLNGSESTYNLETFA